MRIVEGDTDWRRYEQDIDPRIEDGVLQLISRREGLVLELLALVPWPLFRSIFGFRRLLIVLASPPQKLAHKASASLLLRTGRPR